LLLEERSAELFDKGESCHQICEAPPIIALAAPQNYAAIPQLKLSRFVKIYDLAVERDVQPNSRYRNINPVRVCSFVCQQSVDALDRFHVYGLRKGPAPP
jgi:hypothetical protein